MVPGPELAPGEWQACLRHVADLQAPPAYLAGTALCQAADVKRLHRELAVTAG